MLSPLCTHTVNRKAYNQVLLLCFRFSSVAQQHSATHKKSSGFHCTGRCTNTEWKSWLLYLSSHFFVKCHHPCMDICWATCLSSLQSARQRDHQPCNTQAFVLLKRIFIQPLLHQHCALSTMCGSKLWSFLYTNVFMGHHLLKLVLGWSSSWKYFAKQTHLVVSLLVVSLPVVQLVKTDQQTHLTQNPQEQVEVLVYVGSVGQEFEVSKSYPFYKLPNLPVLQLSVQLLISFPKT